MNPIQVRYHMRQMCCERMLRRLRVAADVTAGNQRDQIVTHSSHILSVLVTSSHVRAGPVCGRVAAGDYSPAAPTDLDMQNSRIQLLSLRNEICCEPRVVGEGNSADASGRTSHELESESPSSYLPLSAT